jgi:hypothetical protein
MLILVLLGDQKFNAFFGNYGRNMGWFQQLGFGVLFLLTALSFDFKTLTKFFDLSIVLGAIIAVYGIFQYNGIDFISYADGGRPVIATLGNSNFASAFIGLTCIPLVWKITATKHKLSKFALGALLISEVLVINISKSTQGFFVFLFGVLFFFGIRFFTSRPKMGFVYFFTLTIGVIFGFFGLLQIGPLTKFVYQGSTSFRGDYFRAAWEMFKSNPVKGVGIDSFGMHYRTFRDAKAAFRVGPNVTVDYAHNICLQLLSTGGIFLFLAYLISFCFVLLAIKRGFTQFRGDEKYLFGTLVSMWLGYQLQEQVSPNQLTLTAFGAVISGAIIALGFNGDLIHNNSNLPKQHLKIKQSPTVKVIANGLSILFVVLSIFIISPRWGAEQNIRSSKLLSASFSDLRGIALKEDLALSAVALQPLEVKYRFLAADVFLTTGNMEGARLQLKEVLSLNPKSDLSMVYLASLYEYSEEWNEAIKLRILASKLDPFNTINYFQLGKDLATIGDYQALNKLIRLMSPLSDKSAIVSNLKALLPAAPTS